MTEPLSPEEALAKVRHYTDMDLAAEEIRSLHAILRGAPQSETQILRYLKKAGHRLGSQQKSLPNGQNWWDKVHGDMVAADDNPYVEEPDGNPQQRVAHDRNAVIFWLETRILPALDPVEQVIAAVEEEVQREADAETPPADDYDARIRVIKQAVARRGQPKFRSKLMKAYSGRCAVTGYEAEAALEAAHLRPYRGPESNTVSNGLLLRADIHTLLDLGLVAFNPQTRKVVVSLLLAGTRYESLSGRLLAEPSQESQRPSQHALDTLWQFFVKAESDRGSRPGAVS